MIKEARINAALLLRQPGSTAEIVIDPTAAELDIDDERLAGPVHADLAATSTNDAVRLTGEIRVPWRTVCRRCAVPIEGVGVTDVDELYQLTVTDTDAYPIEGDFIEVVPVIRQYALLELPDGALCRSDCAGLCPHCGTDRNDAACDCTDDTRDPRWAVLDQFDIGGSSDTGAADTDEADTDQADTAGAGDS